MLRTHFTLHKLSTDEMTQTLNELNDVLVSAPHGTQITIVLGCTAYDLSHVHLLRHFHELPTSVSIEFILNPIVNQYNTLLFYYLRSNPYIKVHHVRTKLPSLHDVRCIVGYPIPTDHQVDDSTVSDHFLHDIKKMIQGLPHESKDAYDYIMHRISLNGYHSLTAEFLLSRYHSGPAVYNKQYIDFYRPLQRHHEELIHRCGYSELHINRDEHMDLYYTHYTDDKGRHIRHYHDGTIIITEADGVQKLTSLFKYLATLSELPRHILLSYLLTVFTNYLDKDHHLSSLPLSPRDTESDTFYTYIQKHLTEFDPSRATYIDELLAYYRVHRPDPRDSL